MGTGGPRGRVSPLRRDGGRDCSWTPARGSRGAVAPPARRSCSPTSARPGPPRAVLWAHASTPAVLWRPLSAPSAPSAPRHRRRWGPRSPRHKFRLLTPGLPWGPCLCTETAALIQRLPQEESLTWRGGEVGWLAGFGGWVLETEQMQAPPPRSSPGHPTGGNQKPRQGEQLRSSPGLRTCLATGLGWEQVLQGPSCPAV